jgi:aryl carrier-like protein
MPGRPSLAARGHPDDGGPPPSAAGQAPALDAGAPAARAGGHLGGEQAESDPGGVRASLTAMWEELISEFRPGLGTTALGPDEDLLAAGGTSILAVMMLGRIYDEMGVDVSFGDLLERPTIRGLSQRVVHLALAGPAPGSGASSSG